MTATNERPTPTQEQRDAFAVELAKAMEPVHEVVYRAAAAGLTPGDILESGDFLLSRSLGFTECLPDDLMLPRYVSVAVNEAAAQLDRDPDCLLGEAAPALVERVRQIQSGAAPTLTIPAEAQAQIREVAAVLGIDAQELANDYVAQAVDDLGDPESGMIWELLVDAGADPAALERFKAWCASKGLRPDRFRADIDDALADRQAA